MGDLHSKGIVRILSEPHQCCSIWRVFLPTWQNYGFPDEREHRDLMVAVTLHRPLELFLRAVFFDMG